MTKTDIGRRLGFEDQQGDVVLLDAYEIFYIEVDGHDSVIRTARRKTLRSSARLSRLVQRLPQPPFFRCHESFMVNLDRVRKVERKGRDLRLRMDPPVNRLIPLGRGRVAEFRKLIGLDR